MKKLFLVVAIAAGLFVSNASAFDRHPLTLDNATTDGWYQTITSAERNLHGRFGGIRSVYCTGAILTNDPADSSLMHGGYRYWDKLWCFGKVDNGNSFTLVFDQKSEYRWIIFNLRGVSIVALYYGGE